MYSKCKAPLSGTDGGLNSQPETVSVHDCSVPSATTCELLLTTFHMLSKPGMKLFLLPILGQHWQQNTTANSGLGLQRISWHLLMCLLT